MAGSSLNRGSGEPLYLQLAAALRQDIAEGHLPPGVAFPSERKLMARYRVTRTTVRSAISVLKQEGMVLPEHGAGSFVRDPRAGRRRVEAREVAGSRPTPPAAPAGPRSKPPERPFRITAVATDKSQHMPLTPWVAELMRLEPGTEVLVQEAVGIDGTATPVVARVWLHPEAKRRSGIVEADMAGTWLPELLAERGIPAGEGEDVVETAMPTPELKAVLGLPDGVPVLQLYRVMREAEEVVAVVESQLPGDMTTLVFPRIPAAF